jgi:hypothetical protein
LWGKFSGSEPGGDFKEKIFNRAAAQVVILHHRGLTIVSQNVKMVS